MITALYALLSTAFTLVCWALVNWWAPLFANDAGWLPNWLAWVQTFDDSLDAGQRDGIYPSSMPRYLARVFWLYRNTGYGFNYWALGVPFSPADWQVMEYDADPAHFTFRAVGPNGWYNTHIVRHGIRLKFGWKAWNMWDPATARWRSASWGPVWRVPFTFSISKA